MQMEAAVGVGAQLLSACQDAHSKQAMSAAMYVSWANWADRLGQPKVGLDCFVRGAGLCCPSENVHEPYEPYVIKR